MSPKGRGHTQNVIKAAQRHAQLDRRFEVAAVEIVSGHGRHPASGDTDFLHRLLPESDDRLFRKICWGDERLGAEVGTDRSIQITTGSSESIVLQQRSGSCDLSIGESSRVASVQAARNKQDEKERRKGQESKHDRILDASAGMACQAVLQSMHRKSSFEPDSQNTSENCRRGLREPSLA